MKAGVDISKRIALINATSSVVQRLLNLTVLVWLQRYFIHYVEQDEYAVYNVVMSLIFLLPIITGGLGGGMARFVVDAYARHDHKRVVQVISTMGPLSFAVAGLVLLVGWPIAYYLDHLITIADKVAQHDPQLAARIVTDARLMFAILVTNSAVRICATPFRLGLHVRQKFMWMHLISLASELVRVGVLAGLLLGVDVRVLWVAVAQVPAMLLEISLSVTLSRRLLPLLRVDLRQFRRDLILPVMMFGGWTLVAWAAAAIREAANLLLLNEHCASKTQVNGFKLGSMVDGQVRQIAAAPIPSMQPMVTAMYATGQYERIERTTFRFGRYLLWVLLLPAVPLIVFRHELWDLYVVQSGRHIGEGMTSLDVRQEVASIAAVVMMLLLARLTCMFSHGVLIITSIASGQPGPYAIRLVLLEMSGLALSAYLVVVQGMGAVGAAIGVLASNVIGYPWIYFTLGLRLSRASSGAWLGQAMVRGLLPALLAAPAWLALRWWLPPDGWLQLGAETAAGALVYAGAVLLCMSPHDRGDLGQALSRVRSKLLR